MLHADEGLLHAYLDGELEPAPRAALEGHLAVCPPCRGRLAEARAFVAESDDLVLALDPATGDSAPAPRRAPRAWYRRPATWAWAASLVAAVGLGYTWRDRLPATSVESAAPPAPRVPAEVAARPVPSAPAASDAADRRARASTPRPAPGPETKATSELPQPAAAGAGVTLLAQAATEAAPPATPAAPPESAAVRYEDGVPVPADAPVAANAFGPALGERAARRITMEEAVAQLGGSIRLIDGLTPRRIETIAGVDVAGADPNRDVVRIYYEEPDLGTVTLDQQRPAAAPLASTRDDLTQRVEVAPMPRAAGRMVAPAAGLSTLTWRAEGVWLSLRSRLPRDRMAALQGRIR